MSAINGTMLGPPGNVGSITKLQENAFLTFGELTNGQVSRNIVTSFNPDISTFSTCAATGLLGAASPNTSQDVLARTSGITAPGTAQADTFKGTAFNDVFQVINQGDRVDGGGNDTVIFARDLNRGRFGLPAAEGS